MKTVRFWTVVAAMAAAGVVTAENYVWTGGGTDAKWTTIANWKVQGASGPAANYPQAGDVILVGGDVAMPLDLSDTESVGVLNAVDAVQLAESGSIFNVAVPSGVDVTITTPIRGGSGATGSSSSGQMYFTGPGTVRLDATNMSDYCMAIFSADGTDVWLPQANDLLLKQYNLGSVTLTNGATLHLPTRHNGSLNMGANYVMTQRLYGDGGIAASEKTELRFGGSGGVFSGTIAADIRIFSGGVEYLTGTNSPMSWYPPRVHGGYKNWSTGAGILGVKKFGKAGENSSIGKLDSFQTNVRGGTYLYLGDGEETDKHLSVYANNDGYSTIDGGAYGGLTFIGNGGFNVGLGTVTNSAIVGLNGSNAAACVFLGKCRESAGYLATIVKKGTGTWRFASPDPTGYMADMSNRTFRGSISVDEGVLQFDTVSPPGERCSVGLATVLKEPRLGVWVNQPDVDWAFSLGGTNAALKALAEGTLEYTGAIAGLCDRRKIRLEADGRLRANSAKKIRYRMTAPTSPRAKKLTLDGVSTASNEVHDVTDSAEYPVSVVKEGPGTWILGGDQSFHGDLEVKGGTLIVRKYDAGSQYTWFRFTVKDLFDPVASSWVKRFLSIRYFGLFDIEGWSQTLSTRESEDSFAASVEPGEAGYDTTRNHSKGVYSSKVPEHNDNITNLFGTAYVYDVGFFNDSNSDVSYPRLAETNTWVSYVVRLTNGAPAIASYDWANTYGWNSADKAGFHWTPRVWVLEGSVDGIHWENVKADGGDFSITTNDYPWTAYSGYFIYSGVGYSPSASGLGPNSPVRHSGGCPIRGTSQADYAVLSNVRSVSVVDGATLEADGLISLASLTVDAGDATGTIKGFSFADDCMINVANAGPGVSVELPLVLADAPAGAINTSGWQVKVDGVAVPYSIRVQDDGRLVLCRPGTIITVR